MKNKISSYYFSLKKKKQSIQIVLILTALTITQELFSQNKATIYYDKNWKITTPENSQYHREAGMDFISIIFNGEFKDFDKENHLIAEGNYVNGFKKGIYKTYFTDGTLKSSIEWNGDDFTIFEWKDEVPEYCVLKGTGKFRVKFSIPFSGVRDRGILSGEFKDNLRVGRWKYRDSLGNLLFEEMYKKGEFVRALMYVEPDLMSTAIKKNILAKGGVVTPDERTVPTSKLNIKITPFETVDFMEFDKTKIKNLYSVFSQMNEFCRPQTNSAIRYPGADNEIGPFIAKLIRYPPAARRNNVQGQVLVRIVVGQDGTVKKYSIAKSDSHEYFDAEALRVAELLEHKWFPSHNQCQPFESFIILPISFRLAKSH